MTAPGADSILLALCDPAAAASELLPQLDEPLRTVAAALRRGPDPRGGLLRMRNLLVSVDGLRDWLDTVLEAPRAASLLTTILAQSPYLSQMLAKHPHLCQELAQSPYLEREKDYRTMLAELQATLGSVTEPEAVARVLRSYRNHEYLRLGARELGWGGFAEVGRELSALAAACLEVAVASARVELEERFGAAVEEDGRRARFCVIGMGKLGGDELNFSSDIDLIYVYSSDAGAAGALSLHELFVKLAERTTRLMADLTDQGFVFRVDLRLRPEGSRGPLANSRVGLESYYETWGRPWERQAWLKARPVAGDLDLGEEVLGDLEPFVYPRTTSPRVIDEINDLNRRIKAELRKPATRDIKLGPGGIREIEFFAQALQRLHAGKNPTLREPGTLRALDRLLFAGLISEREQRLLAEAYVFLRRLEHRLQLHGGVQTQLLPGDEADLALIGRRLGYGSVATFRAALARHRDAVAEIFRTLGLPEEPPTAMAPLLDPQRSPEELRGVLAALGFRDPEASSQELELLREKPESPFAEGATGAAAGLAPLLLEEVVSSPDPDLALRHLTHFVGRRGSWSGLWTLLAHNRPLVRLLISLFGMSDFLAKLFLAHPELLDQLLVMPSAKSKAQLREELDRRLATADGTSYEDVLNLLRRWRNEEILRLGLLDSAGGLDVLAVQEQLTDIAEVVVERVVPLVIEQVAERYGAPTFRSADGTPASGAALAIIGLGKLGGRELTYASDLDLIFVYAGASSDTTPRQVSRQEWFSRVATRLIQALGAYLEEGRLYVVDTRLRPSGQQGTLVSSLAAFEEYHRAQAMLWERQALIRARFVAGDEELGGQVEALCQEHVYGAAGASPHPESIAREIGRLRDRMEKELAREKAGQYNVKSGRGGLVDIEFITQYLQLRYGGDKPEVRAPGTFDALRALRAAGALDDTAGRVLEEAYLFLRLLENRLRIVQDRSISEFRAEPDEIEKLARRMGYAEPRSGDSGTRLLADYLLHAGRVRELYRTFFPGPVPVSHDV